MNPEHTRRSSAARMQAGIRLRAAAQQSVLRDSLGSLSDAGRPDAELLHPARRARCAATPCGTPARRRLACRRCRAGRTRWRGKRAAWAARAAAAKAAVLCAHVRCQSGSRAVGHRQAGSGREGRLRTEYARSRTGILRRRECSRNREGLTRPNIRTEGRAASRWSPSRRGRGT